MYNTLVEDQMLLGPFPFFGEERVALLLCQAKGEHSRLVPQDLCPREVLIDEMKLILYHYPCPLSVKCSLITRAALTGVP